MTVTVIVIVIAIEVTTAKVAEEGGELGFLELIIANCDTLFGSGCNRCRF